MKLTHNEFYSAIPESCQDRTMITVVAPFAPGEFATNVVVTRHFVAAHESVEAFAEEQLKIMRESVPNFELLDYRTTTLNELPAVQQLHRFQTENGFLQQVQTFVLADRKIYVITGTSTVNDFERHIGAFREIVENLQISNNG